MYYFLAHKKLLSRMLDLGLFDELFASIEKYTAGDANAKRYLQECAQAYEININFPRKDKFTKELHFSLFFEAIYNYINISSIHVMYTLLTEKNDIYYFDGNLEDIEATLNKITDEHLNQVLECLDYNVLLDYDFAKFKVTVEEEDLKHYVENLPKARSIYDLNLPPDFPFTAFENFRYLGYSNEALNSKFGYLNNTAYDLLQPKNKFNANSATSAHKRRVNKRTAKAKEVSNKIAAANLGYRLSDDLPLSYFQPSKSADFGFNLIKNIDLFGLHLILVAQRRKFYFEATLCDEYRCNFDPLEHLDLNTLVSLHDKAVKACQAYQAACSSQTNTPQLHTKCFSTYLVRNAALAEYAGFYNNLFADFGLFSYQLNHDDQPWFITKLFYNLNLVYEPLINFCQDSCKKELLFLFTNSPNKALDVMRNFDNSLIEVLNKRAPLTIYQACSKFASTFNSIESTHPLTADFKDIAQKVLNYSQELKVVYPQFPFPIELDNYVYTPHNYHFDRNQTALIIKDGFSLNAPSKFNLCSQVLKLNLNLNDYALIFNCLSIVLDTINDAHLQLFAFKSDNQGMPALFNWYGDNSNEVDAIFPIYKKWCALPVVAKLADAHKHCLELLVLIMDLKGELHELYQDPYFVQLLKNTDSYDEKFAQSLNDDQTLSKEPTKLSSQDNVLLNKATVNFLNYVNEFTKNYYELLDTSVDFVNEIVGNIPNNSRITYYSVINGMKLILSFVHYFSYSLIVNLGDISQELKTKFASHEQDYENSKINVLFYNSIKEVIFIFSGKTINNFTRSYSSYWNYQEADSFKKYYSLVCPDIRLGLLHKADTYALLAMERLLALNPNLDAKDIVKIKQSVVCENDFSQLAIRFAANLTYIVLSSIGCCLVNYIAKLTTKKSVVAHINEINLLVSLVKRLSTTAPLEDYALSLRSQANADNNFLMENYEFRAVLGQYLGPLKFATQVVLHPNYADFKLTAINHDNFLIRCIDFFEQLLADPKTVLSYLNPLELKKHIFKLPEVRNVSSAPFYGPVVFNFPNYSKAVLKETNDDKNTVGVFLTLFGKEFTEALHPRVYFEQVAPNTNCLNFYPHHMRKIECKPIVAKALNEMLTELSDDAIASALESIDIYQGIDKSVDNWNALEYDIRAYPYFGEPFYSAPAQAPVDESEDKSEADDGFGDNDGEGEGDAPLARNKNDVLQELENNLKAHRTALDKAQDQDEISKLSRRLAMIDDFLFKAMMLARGFHSAKVDFEIFTDRASELYCSFVYQGMHIEEVQALSSVMLLFLDYIELIWSERAFNNNLCNVAKVKADYIP